MKRRALAIVAFALVFASNAYAGKMYWRTALTGSTAGALDAISEAAATPGVPLATGDSAMVISGATYYYTFNSTSTAPESSPAVIAPDDAGVSGRWLRVPSYLVTADVSGLATVATSGSYGDLSDTPAIPDLSAPGPIGGTVPDAGFFTDITTTGNATIEGGLYTTGDSEFYSNLYVTGAGTFDSLAAVTATAQQLILGPQPVGTTGELSLPEDPANPGDNTVGWKAPANIANTIKWIMPAADGSAGQFLKTNGQAVTAWSGLESPGPIGTTTPDDVHAVDVVADSLVVNPGPSGTTETITLREDVASSGGNQFIFKADTSIAADTTVLVPSQLPRYVTTCPTVATGSCTAGQQCYSATYFYICTAANVWKRAALGTW